MRDTFSVGCAVAQVDICSFSPWGPRFKPRLVSLSFVVDRVALGHVCFEHFGVACQLSFQESSLSLVIRGWCNGPI